MGTPSVDGCIGVPAAEYVDRAVGDIEQHGCIVSVPCHRNTVLARSWFRIWQPQRHRAYAGSCPQREGYRPRAATAQRRSFRAYQTRRGSSRRFSGESSTSTVTGPLVESGDRRVNLSTLA